MSEEVRTETQPGVEPTVGSGKYITMEDMDRAIQKLTGPMGNVMQKLNAMDERIASLSQPTEPTEPETPTDPYGNPYNPEDEALLTRRQALDMQKEFAEKSSKEAWQMTAQAEQRALARAHAINEYRNFLDKNPDLKDPDSESMVRVVVQSMQEKVAAGQLDPNAVTYDDIAEETRTRIRRIAARATKTTTEPPLPSVITSDSSLAPRTSPGDPSAPDDVKTMTSREYAALMEEEERKVRQDRAKAMRDPNYGLAPL